MARRKTFNRVHRRNSKRSIDSIGSGILDPNSTVVDEEQTFWWNHLQENTFPRHSSIYNEDETARHLSVNSQTDFRQGSSEWWKNLEQSDDEQVASTSSRRNLSAAIVNTNILQASTSSESEKERDLRKKKVHLKAANNRKSSNNDFEDALNNIPTVSVPLKLRMKQANYSNFHSDSNREVSREKLQENEEDSNLSSTGNILKSKPTISRKRRGRSKEDQNTFQNILTEDDVLNASVKREVSRKELQENEEDSNLSPTGNILKSKPSISRKRRGRSKEDLNTFQNILTEDDVLNASVRREVLREELQDNEEDSNLSPTDNILKSKRTISRKRKGESIEDQNTFQNILTEDVLNARTTRKSVAFEKESSRLSMHRIIDANKDRTDDQRKSMSASQAMPPESDPGSLNLLITSNTETAMLKSNANEIAQSSNESNISIVRNKFQSRLKQRARKSVGKNAFADALADDSSPNLFDPNKENDIHVSSPLSPSKRSANQSKNKIDITHQRSSVRRSSQSSLNVAQKQSLNASVQAEDNIEINSSSSSLDNNESRGMKRSIFFKPKPILKGVQRESLNENLFKEIFEKDDNINARKSNVSIKSNHASFKQGETTTSQVHGSSSAESLIEKSSQSQRIESMTENEYDDMLLTISPNIDSTHNVAKAFELNVSLKNKSKQSDNSDLTKASKSISQKEIIAKTPEKQNSSSRKSTREETLNEHTRAEAELRINRTSSDKTIYGATGDDKDVEQDLNLSKRTRSSPGKEARLTRNSLRNRSEILRFANTGVQEAIDNSRNDASREYDSSTSKRASKSSSDKETRLTRNSLRNQFETSRLANTGIQEVTDKSRNRELRANREYESSTSERASKSSPGKESRLTRNSLRDRSETLRRANTGIQKVIDNSRNETNRDYDSDTPNRTSKSSPDKEARLTRNNLRDRSETPRRANTGVQKVIDNSRNETNRDYDSGTPERASKSSPGKESRLTRNSLRDRSETLRRANTGIQKVIDNSRNETNRDYDSDTPNRTSKSSPDKEARLTRNNLRDRSETPRRANTGVQKVIDNSRNETNRDYDSGTPERASKSSPGKEGRLTRNSLRDRSETPRRANTGIQKVIDNSRNETNRDYDSGTPERASKSSPGKEGRLTRNSLRDRSETPRRANTGIQKVIDNSRNETNRDYDSGTPNRTSKSSPDKEVRLTRNSLRDRFETSKSANIDKELSKRSTNRIIDNIDENSEINADNISQVISSTRISKDNANTGIHKRIILSTEMEITDDEDADPVRQTIQRDSTSTRVHTSNKTVNWQSVQNSSRTSIRDGIETARRQKSMNKSQNYRNTSIKSSNKVNSFNKEDSSKTLRKIDDFFKVKQASTMEQSSERTQKSQIFGSEKMDKIKAVLEKIKNREMAAMKISATDKRESALKAKNVKSIKQNTKKKPLANNPTTKKVDKAFLINGEVYKAPRLPRPKHWATNRLYKFLWVRMEPKYKLATQLKSEKFIRRLSEVISLIERRKDHKNYKTEMRALVQEMARLKIINTYNDFFNFCQDFLPYEFRIKVVPMILPGNKKNVPYDVSKLHVPVLDSSTNE